MVLLTRRRRRRVEENGVHEAVHTTRAEPVTVEQADTRAADYVQHEEASGALSTDLDHISRPINQPAFSRTSFSPSIAALIASVCLPCLNFSIEPGDILAYPFLLA